jgi:hypothetical protein
LLARDAGIDRATRRSDISANEHRQARGKRRHLRRMLIDVEEAGKIALVPIIATVRVGEGKHAIPIL